MSDRGKILVAKQNGTFLLQFVGDVRLTLCVAIDDYLKQMFDDPDFEAVIVDLCRADCLDSTSLGLLAKLAQETADLTKRRPLLVCHSADLLMALSNLGVDELFEAYDGVVAEATPATGARPEGFSANPDEAAMRLRVIEAHRVLMALNSANADAFKDLVEQLESLESGAG